MILDKVRGNADPHDVRVARVLQRRSSLRRSEEIFGKLPHGRTSAGFLCEEFGYVSPRIEIGARADPAGPDCEGVSKGFPRCAKKGAGILAIFRGESGINIVSEGDLAEQLRKRPDAVATALNLLLSEQKIQRAPLKGYWKLNV
jgi:hypothetical protein